MANNIRLRDSSGIVRNLDISGGGTGADNPADAIINLLAGCTVYTETVTTSSGALGKQWTVHGSGFVVVLTDLQTYNPNYTSGEHQAYVNILTNGNSDQLCYVNNYCTSFSGWLGACAFGFAKVTDGQVIEHYSVTTRPWDQIKRIHTVAAFGCTLT